MKLGVVFPTSEIGHDPSAVTDYVQAAEELGYSRLSIFEHVLGAEHTGRSPELRGPYTENTPFHEPMVLFGFLAGVTTSIELCTGVLVLPQRQTALVAKQATEIDLLSRGRLVLGLGTGWNHVEFEGLGCSYADRGRRLDEQVTVMRALWRDPVVDVDSTFHRISRAGINPRPTRRIPLLFGGSAPAALRRAARLGDGFILRSAGERRRQEVGQLRRLLEEEGRTAQDFQMEAYVDFSSGPGEWQRQAQEWSADGGRMLSLRSFSMEIDWHMRKPSGLKSTATHLAALETFMRAIGDSA